MKRLSDEEWASLNVELATGFDAKGVVLLRYGLTFDTYFQEAQRRANEPASRRLEELLGATKEIDRRKLFLTPTPFVHGKFDPPTPDEKRADAREEEELGETSMFVSPHPGPTLPFKKG